ncbi:MAG: NYN domain-containing protein [bacterium]
MPSYLVDGYNVIHREPALKPLLERDAEAARTGLISMLAGFRAGRRVRVTVVFDGRGGTGLDARTIAAGVQVVYAHFSETADARIVRLVRSSRHPRSLTVVSSDLGLVAQCRDFGASSLGAEEFLARCREVAGRPAAGRGGNGDRAEVTPGEAAQVNAELERHYRDRGVYDRRERPR